MIFVYYSIAIMLIVPIIVAFYILFLFKRSFIEKRKLWFQYKQNKFFVLKPSQVLLIMLVVANAVFFGILRYTEFNFPQGSDTSIYIYFLEKLQGQGYFQEILDVITVPKLFFVYFLYFIWKVSLVDIYTYMKVIPTITLALFSLSWYYLAFKLSGRYFFGFLTALLTPTWFGTIRLSYDLHSNLFALSLLNILLAILFFEFTVKNGKISKKTVLEIILLYIFVTFSHQYTATIGLALVILYIITQNLFFKWRLTLTEMFLVATMIFILGLSYCLTFVYSPHVYYNLASTQELYLGYLIFLSSKDTLIIIVLSLMSLILLTSQISKNNIGLPEHYIFLYMGLVSSLTLITNRLIWRIWLLYPIPLLAAYTLDRAYSVINWLNNIKLPCNVISFRIRHFGAIAIASVLLFQILFSYSNACTSEIAYVPQFGVVNNYLAIRTKYGFSNQSIRVYINEEQSYYHRWALATLGDVVIAGGNLIDKDKHLSLDEWKAKYFTTTYTDSLFTLLSEIQNKTIIIPYTLFNDLTSDEKTLTKLIGKHEEESNSIIIPPINLDTFIQTKAFVMINSSYLWKIDWPKGYQKYNISVTYDNYTEFSVVTLKDSYVVFRLDKELNITCTQNATVAVKYKITNSSLNNIYVEAVYEKQKRGFTLDPTKELLLVNIELPITSFNLVVKPTPEFENLQIDFKVNYIALVSTSLCTHLGP